MKKNLFLLLASFLMLMGAKAERLPVNATHGGVLVENKAVVGVLALYQRCTLKDDISYLLPT